MYQIRPWLFTSSHHATHDLSILQDHNIGAMLQLFRPVQQEGIESTYIAIEDGYPLTEEMLDKALDFIRKSREAGHTLLIACGAGISRSTTFAMAALKVIEGLTIPQAFWTVREGNPRAMPDQDHWDGLCAYFDEDASFWDLWQDAVL